MSPYSGSVGIADSGPRMHQAEILDQRPTCDGATQRRLAVMHVGVAQARDDDEAGAVHDFSAIYSDFCPDTGDAVTTQRKSPSGSSIVTTMALWINMRTAIRHSPS